MWQGTLLRIKRRESFSFLFAFSVSLLFPCFSFFRMLQKKKTVYGFLLFAWLAGFDNTVAPSSKTKARQNSIKVGVLFWVDIICSSIFNQKNGLPGEISAFSFFHFLQINMEYTNNKRILFPREKGSAQPAGHKGMFKKPKKKEKKGKKAQKKEKVCLSLLCSLWFLSFNFFFLGPEQSYFGHEEFYHGDGKRHYAMEWSYLFFFPLF